MNVQSTHEAQQCLEGFLQIKTTLHSETEEDWIFRAGDGKLYNIRKYDGATFCNKRLIVLLALNEHEASWSRLILSLLKQFPDGVEFLEDDPNSFYFAAYQIKGKKRLRATIQYSKANGSIRMLEVEQWNKRREYAG
ncbi:MULTISPECIES: hypothetical protein [Shouchella]|uniref:Uncharacterized protein n=2 Tax=Shouchella TaxID=2893057 RepID=A0ABY7W0X5_9BACI|nr:MULTISPECIES: hypothetical protein [Shouchella]MED4128428.1 hypothetical protein [Shouchella miscanthi]WDF02603.1 hypothetical protein PQ477_13890 [Shouchella hunanensis]GAF20794.1 hypothetical protein JCM19047_451 [Bacillus sp. JCM 19047]